ncbi:MULTISPECIES: division plane positioning ATPase MipZ [unclassified Thioalkalivibrio]|uniref:nucleotide-binding protein n=1 Tax=unclassified Thioalkalivibrio TaxID=2621013 RepID=UPI00036BC9AB|nr:MULTISPECIES: division plane positioning ATPase MipZ [unclassified Thioalkalivibrio]
MRTVVANLKGGTGKSTVTFNLALWLLEQGRSVCTVDLDPQGTLTDVLEVREEEGYIPALEHATSLKAVAEQGQQAWQEILVDVGASDMGSLFEALESADRLLIPVPPSQADVWSTQRFVRRVQESHQTDGRPQILVFINRADTHQAVRETDETFDALGQIPGVKRLAPRLKQRMAFRRSFSEGLSVRELEPRGKASRELEALAIALFGKPGRRRRK